MSERYVYKIADKAEWRAAQREGIYRGAPIDLADGFIHFSTGPQVRETAARHFAGVDNLVLAQIDGELLDRQIAWEPSRGGDLFPHLYGPLKMEAVLWVRDLPLKADGRHRFPEELG